MKLFGKKKTSHLNKVVDINKVITIDHRQFLFDNLTYDDKEVKLNVFMDGDYFLIYEADIDDLWGALIEYIGFHNYSLWINGLICPMKKNYRRMNQLIDTSENLKFHVYEGNVNWKNIGRQTLVCTLGEKVKHIENVELIKDTHTSMISVQKTFYNIPIGEQVDIEVNYDPIDENKKMIIRKLTTREVKLHPEVQEEMVRRNHTDDTRTLNVISKYHNLIVYCEVTSTTEEVTVSLQTKFEPINSGFGGWHTYDELPELMWGSKIEVKELGLIPKALQSVDIRIGYLRIEDETEEQIRLL